MQILDVLRQIPSAIAKDWEQFRCGLRGHDLRHMGTSHEGATPVPGRPGVWNIGKAKVEHYRCTKCDKSVQVPC